MGCTTSKEKAGSEQDATKCRLRNRPPPSIRPPTPPPSTPDARKRKASNQYLENPHRKWQRRQMGSELFDSTKRTPERVPTLPAVGQTLPPDPSRYQHRSYSPQPGDDKEKDDKSYPTGTALAYAPEADTYTPPQVSSVYSEPQITPSNEFRRSHSYRSYSGRMMYSPARFPMSSSPYGTPTIRMVRKSTTKLGEGDGDVDRKDEDAKTQLTETTIDDDTLDRLGLHGPR